MYSKSLQEFINKGENVVDLELREKELISIVEQEIANLPPQMRLVFEMSRNLELSHKEIASELNISSHTVRTQVRNALRILRVKLSSDIFSIFF
ncbi:RNA polymerase sigma factor [compost metagenome]